MAIVIKDGFCFFESSNNRFSMIMDNRIDDIVEYVNFHNIKSLTIQPHLHDIILDGAVQEYLLSNIAYIGFLEQMPNLSEVRLIDVENCDIKGLYSLKDLKSLTITNFNNNPRKNVAVEFNRFEKLEEINVDWFSNGFDISENRELSSLFIRKFCPNCGNFTQLQLPSKLSRMEIIQSNIYNLNGIQCNTLESLELSYCPQITSLNGIHEASSQLHKLIVENAKHLTDYSEMKYCQALKHVAFVQCGDIKSLEWVGSLPNLSHLVLEKTTVTDGDMSALLKIDKVAFTNKKHYNCKCVPSSNGDWLYRIIQNWQ